MAPPLATYVQNYPVFNGLTQPEYDFAVTSSAPELALISWGDLAGRAEEMLIGHLLIVANPTRWQAAMNFQRVEVNDRGYAVTNSSKSDRIDNYFYREYLRLLAIVQGSSEVTTTLEQGRSYIVQRPAIAGIEF